MDCPFCGAKDTRVLDSRLVSEGSQVRRRRECPICAERFTTYEIAELVMPYVIKRNGMREPFNEDKMIAGLQRALEKRPISIEQMTAIVNHIKHELRAKGEREVSSSEVGKLVMEELKKVDRVAYVRFASVYLRFEDIDAFSKEIKQLEQDKKNK